MGVDLTLVPERFAPSDCMLGVTRFMLDRNSDMFNVLRKLPINRFSSKFRYWKYGDDGLETVNRTPYDDPLTFLYASDFSELPADFNEEEELSEYNSAVFAFIRKLPPETRILLWWH